MISQHPAIFEFATSSKDIRRIKKYSKIASLIGIEGGHSIDNSLAVLRMYYDLGARYLTLTHSCNTAWADSCNDSPMHDGLTEFGRAVIAEMNRLGMLIDISHVSHKTMRDVLSISKSPVIFSHSSAFSICENPRNVPDDVLHLIKKLDGIVMINFYSYYISCKNASTLMDVVEHIMYIGNLIGFDKVGLGADYNGVQSLPVGLEDVSKYPDLFIALADLGLDDDALKGIMGENLLRILEIVEDRSGDSDASIERSHLVKTCSSLLIGGYN